MAARKPRSPATPNAGAEIALAETNARSEQWISVQFVRNTVVGLDISRISASNGIFISGSSNKWVYGKLVGTDPQRHHPPTAVSFDGVFVGK